MKMLNILLLLLITSCASHFKTLYTMEDKERPNWATEDTPLIESDDQFNFIGVYEIDNSKNLNMNSVKKASELKAFDEVSKKIISDYQARTDIENNGMKQVENIEGKATLITKSLMKNAQVSGRWYRVTEQKISGEKVQRMQYFTKITISKRDFKKSSLELN